MNRKRIQAYVHLFDDLGCELLSVTATGKVHFKLVVTFRGNRRFFIAPNSPSDSQRGFKNFRADVRKWIKSIMEQPEHDNSPRTD